MATIFKLAASLVGHEDDVKSVAFPNPSLVVSASRDAYVRLWKLEQASPPRFDDTISSRGSSFVNSVAFIPPSSQFSEGLVVAGGRDGLLDVRSPIKTQDAEPDATLPSHEGNVCAIDISTDGDYFVSGSWDTSAAIWKVGKWDDCVRLEGHEAAVWGVLAYDKDTIITASADKHIRIWNSSGKLIRRFQGSDDVVRALVRLPPNHPSGGQFASAGNDNRIRMWTLQGVMMGDLYGHENFIYSLAILPSGEIVSSSEDRTVRIWKGNECVQTITHPAISVWSVAVCKDNGDIVTGASDKIARVFSRSPERQGDAQTIQEFEVSVQASSIPQQALGDINKTDMPGPEFIQNKSGTKDGQVQLIKETNGNVTAYQWSSQGNEWVSVGTVVDSAGSAAKVTYNGQDYDYVFDVDIEDGKPPLKLPFNASQSPWEVARKFITDNKLPMTYLDSVVDFINKNTQGAHIGNQSQNGTAGGADPWGQDSRYRPGTGAESSQAPPPALTPSRVLPQKTYLAISTGSHKMMLKKIQEYNDQLKDENRKDLVLQPNDLEVLTSALSKLESVAGKQEASISLAPAAVIAAIRGVTEWPINKRLPWLDLLRLLVAASADTITQLDSPPDNLVTRLANANVFDKATTPENNVMLAVRTLANLFCSEPGRALAESSFDTVVALVEPFSTTLNKNLAIALGTLYINYAVLLTNAAKLKKETSNGNSAADSALSLLSALTSMLNTSNDPEALYRALVAAGSVLCLGKDFAEVAKEGLEIEQAVERAENVGKEERIKALVKEIHSLLDV